MLNSKGSLFFHIIFHTLSGYPPFELKNLIVMMMTKKILPFSILSILCFYSCSNDTNPQNISELIIGEWRFVTQSLNGTLQDFEDDCRGEDGIDYQVFRDDMSFQVMDFDLNGGTECTFEEDESFSGKWNISESTLTIPTNINETIDADILVLNQTILQYVLKVDYDEDGDLDDLVIIFEKQ